MNCKIISSSQSQEFKDIKSVTLPTMSGEVQILPGHAEYFTELKEGIITLENGGKKQMPITSGTCYVSGDNISIIL